MSTWQDALSTMEHGQHAVQYYKDEEFLARVVGHYIGEGLQKGENAVMIPAKAHRQIFEQAIEAVSGRPTPEWQRRGNLIIIEAEETLSRLHQDGELDWRLFEAVIGGVIRSLSTRPIRAYGEMVNLLWHWQKRAAAIELENFWNLLLKREKFSLLCAYRLDALSPETYDEKFDSVCHCHGIVLPSEDAEFFRQSVNERIDKVMGSSYQSIVSTLAEIEDPRAAVPGAQKCLLWLSRHMPATAKRVLARNGNGNGNGHHAQ
jgi:DcmR-like sensory protein